MARDAVNKVSVIIPTYNRSKYILESVLSVLSQQLPLGWTKEVIICDDGSTDNTKEVLRELIESKKIKFLEIPHSGNPSIPRNHAIRHSRGDLIAFQDSDDIWTEGKLMKQIPDFEDKKVIMSYGNTVNMDSRGKVKDEPISNIPLRKKVNFKSILETNYISTLTVLIRKDALLEVGLFDENPKLLAIEDYHLWMKVLNKYPVGIKHNNNILAQYRQHDSNISNADSLVSLRRIANAFNLIWGVASTKNRQLLEDSILIIQENITREMIAIGGNTRPTISVVLPIYNAEKFIVETLESILSQTYKKFEIIAVNDGSTDNTYEILNTFQDSRLRIINQTNRGLCYTLNKAIRLGSGEYIARHDADDISLPSRFEKQSRYLNENTNIGLVGSFFTYIDEISSKSLGITISYPTKHIDILRAMYYVNPVGHGTVMFRKECFVNTKGYQESYFTAEDYKLWVDMSTSTRLAIIPESLYLYRISSSSISSTKSHKMAITTRKIQNELLRRAFAKKSISDILTDAGYYRALDISHHTNIFDKYVEQQIEILKISSRIGMLKAPLIQLIALRKLGHKEIDFSIIAYLKNVRRKFTK